MLDRTDVTDVALGSIVALLATAVPFGPVAGGWVAARRVGADPVRGALAGLFAAVPLAAVAVAATTGAIDTVAFARDSLALGVVAIDGSLPLPVVAGVTTVLVGYVVGCGALGGSLAGGGQGADVDPDPAARRQ